MNKERRTLLLAVAVAASIGFGAGWLVQHLRRPSLEERAREKADEIRHRTEELLR